MIRRYLVSKLVEKPTNRRRHQRSVVGSRRLHHIRSNVESAASRLRSVAGSENISDLRFTALSVARQLENLNLPR